MTEKNDVQVAGLASDLNRELALISDDNGYVNFIVKILGDTEYSMDFEVHEVTSWEIDDEKTPSDLELYMTGVIKWGGCSHVWFGEKDDKGLHSGYLHLCGKEYWINHAKMMTALYELAEKTIKGYDSDVGG